MGRPPTSAEGTPPRNSPRGSVAWAVSAQGSVSSIRSQASGDATPDVFQRHSVPWAAEDRASQVSFCPTPRNGAPLHAGRSSLPRSSQRGSVAWAFFAEGGGPQTRRAQCVPAPFGVVDPRKPVLLANSLNPLWTNQRAQGGSSIGVFSRGQKTASGTWPVFGLIYFNIRAQARGLLRITTQPTRRPDRHKPPDRRSRAEGECPYDGLRSVGDHESSPFVCMSVYPQPRERRSGRRVVNLNNPRVKTECKE